MNDSNKTARAKPAQPLVYIIVLTWNGKADTLACLSSLEKIEYSNWRICLVDNASTDGTVAAVRSSFRRVEIIENSENLRFATGNNVGIEYALKQGADYVLLLNNDTRVAEDFLTRLVEVAESDGHIGMAGSKIYHFDRPDLIWSAGGTISFWRGEIAHRGLRKHDAQKYNETQDVAYLTGCTLLVKRGVIEQVGLLDPAYFIYTEDADWCERTRRAGYRLVYVPESKVWHKVSATSGGGLSPFKVTHKLKSNFQFFKKYARWYHWMSIPFFVYGSTFWFITRQLTQGNFGIIASLFKGFKEILTNRSVSKTV
ncbi:MAG: glycosyltransferase family 2 protein [bacterium]